MQSPAFLSRSIRADDCFNWSYQSWTAPVDRIVFSVLADVCVGCVVVFRPRETMGLPKPLAVACDRLQCRLEFDLTAGVLGGHVARFSGSAFRFHGRTDDVAVDRKTGRRVAGSGTPESIAERVTKTICRFGNDVLQRLSAARTIAFVDWAAASPSCFDG